MSKFIILHKIEVDKTITPILFCITKKMTLMQYTEHTFIVNSGFVNGLKVKEKIDEIQQLLTKIKK